VNEQTPIAQCNPDGPGVVQETLRADRVAPARTLLETSVDPTLGTADIPRERYFSQAFHDLEVEKVWKKVWQMACWGQDIPEAGDTIVYDIAGISILVVRQQDGSLKAFRNSCLHRGRALLECSAHVNRLRCPFHAWTWNLDGSVQTIPGKWDFPQMDEAKMNLVPVRLEEWNGFAFINLDDAAPPLSEFLGGMPAQWTEWDLTGRYKALHAVKHMKANWKVVLEAFIESYHVDASHPQQSPFSAAEQTQYDTWEGESHFSRAITLMGLTSTGSPAIRMDLSEQERVRRYVTAYLNQAREELEQPTGQVQDGESAREVMTRLFAKAVGDQLGVNLEDSSPTDIIDGVWYYVFPNFEPWPTLGYPLFYRFRPYGNNPEESLMDIMILSPFEGERPKSAPIIAFGPDEPLEPKLGTLGMIIDQDVAHMAAMQKGLKSCERGLVLAEYQESRIRHYHRTLTNYINA